jgi:hypothetical protein
MDSYWENREGNVQFARNLKNLKTTTKAWAKRKKKQLEHDIIQTEAIFNLFMTLTKEVLSIQHKKRPFYLWKRIEESFYKLGKKNGDKRVGPFGCIAVMRIQNSSKLMQKEGKWKTLFGE